MFAITPKGVGERVGARRIQPGWPLAPGETFTVEEHAFSAELRLAEDGASLRPANAQEQNAAFEAERRRQIDRVDEAWTRASTRLSAGAAEKAAEKARLESALAAIRAAATQADLDAAAAGLPAIRRPDTGG